VRVLSPHTFRISAAGTLKHSRIVTVADEIESATCHRILSRSGRYCGIYITLKRDQSALIYSAKAGVLVGEQPDPLKDSELQAKVSALTQRMRSPIYYAVVKEGGSRWITAFYNFFTGCLAVNELPHGTVLKDREVAVAAAKAITTFWRREENSILCPGRRCRPFRALAVLAHKRGFKSLDKVKGREEDYFPVIRRPRALHGNFPANQ